MMKSTTEQWRAIDLLKISILQNKTLKNIYMKYILWPLPKVSLFPPGLKR
jgi:hypothetical protein